MTRTLTWKLQRGPPVALLRLAGILDLDSIVDARTALHKALARQPTAIVVDLAGLRVDDDLMLTVFTAFARTAAGWPGCAVLLCAARPELVAALDRVGASREAPVYPDLRQALDAANRLPAPRRFDRPLPHTVAACAAARETATIACHRWRVADLTGDAEIVVTELVANAVRHTTGDICLSVALCGGFLHLSVRDDSAEPPRLGRPDPISGAGGRGLQLVDALAAGWGSAPTISGKWVWATLRVRRAQEAGSAL